MRWILVPFAAIGGCSATTLAARLSGVGDPLGGLPFDVRVGLVNAVAAAAFVLVGSAMAPRRRLLCASALFLFGGLVGWVVLGGWYFPEGHSRGYQPSRVPLVMTLSGGLSGIVAIAVRRMLSVATTAQSAREEAGHQVPAA